MACIVPFLCVVGKEHNLTACCTWRCRKTACQHLSLLLCALAEQVHGYLYHCSTCALSVTCLQEPQLALLYGELHVLHVVVVLFELVLQSVQLSEDFRHCLFH